MLSDPQLFQDLMPIQGLAMANVPGQKLPQTQREAPQWRPTKAYPPEKYVAGAVQTVLHGISRLPMVARVTLTDYRGFVIYDTYVRPTQPVSDYRTAQTGLTATHLAGAPPFPEVQQRVAMMLRDRIFVGYALWEFLSVMGLSHPAIDTRDTALFLPFRRSLRYRSNAQVPLVVLVNQFMARNIGLHGDIPTEHARAALDLFRSCEQVWEGIIAAGSWPCALPPDAYANCFV
ncbi:exonuclease domain-containing protein [Phanerochaete sordida]|uniref:Exonuclease domain-containing protein n=1 Tax=Phanerochaete sordida TaxID=48140 RepID=A0A9P3G3U6_9APHY|nr:exonuclease domain-containing protein [Phanerochaete sordida]